MKRAAKIREYLKANPDSTCADCARALDLSTKKVNDAMNLMWRAGMLERKGAKTTYSYTVIRELLGVHSPTRVKQSARERQDKHNAARRKRETPKATQTYTSAPKARTFKQEFAAPKPPVVHQRAETIDEWMQRTGAKPERLADTNQFQHLKPSDIRTLTPAYVR